MATTLQGKKVVVVGGTSGIGFATAKHSLLNLAAEVIVASSTQTKVDSAVQRLQQVIIDHKLPGAVNGMIVDGQNLDNVRAFFKKVGELDHLVWTSGVLVAINNGFKEAKLEEIQSKHLHCSTYKYVGLQC